MGLKLKTASNGSVSLEPTNTASDYTLTVPAQTGSIVTATSLGNVGIGTDTPSSFGSTGRYVTLSATDYPFFESKNSTSGSSYYGSNPTGGYIGTGSAYPLVIATNNTERMRIDSSGRVLIGTSTVEARGTTLYGNGSNGFYIKTTGTCGYLVTQDGTGGSGNYLTFYSNTTATGSVTTNGSTTSYNTTSDYRLKENVAPMTGALATVQSLKPVTYTWKETGEASQGFIAHELQAVVPECVVGEKDAVETYVDEEGNEQTRPVYQGIDTSFLVATLTAAIQELKAVVDAQANTITAMEARLTVLEQA